MKSTSNLPETPKKEISEAKVEAVKKSSVPLNNSLKSSKFSIAQALNKEENLKEENVEIQEENLPENYFSDTDLEREWKSFLLDLKKNDTVIYSAVYSFRIEKIDENTVLIHCPSETAKSEFEKIQFQFFNHFKYKVNHHKIKWDYRINVALKQEVMTKRKLFEKFAKINPLLNDLNGLMHFDFS